MSIGCATNNPTGINSLTEEPTERDIAYEELCDNIPDINADSLPIENRGSFEGLIYLLNADCSFCIGQFLEFVDQCDAEGSDLPVIAIVEEGTVQVAEYYMEKIRPTDKDNITFVESTNRKIVSESLYSCSGTVFRYKNGKVTPLSSH